MGKRLNIGVVINNIEGRYQSRIFKGIQSFAMVNNVNLGIFNGRSINSPYPNDSLFNKVFNLVDLVEMDGVIVFTGSLGTNSDDKKLSSWLKELTDKPVVTVGRNIDGYTGVTSENKKGIIEAIKHLVDKHGRRKFCFVSGPPNNPESIERLEAFKEGLDIVDIKFNENNVYYGDYSYRMCKDITAEIIKDDILPYDAIICASDEMAWSMKKSLEDKGYLIPNDYSLLGFDDLSESAFQKPPLSTIHQDLFSQSYKAGELLIDIISGKNINNLEIESKIIIRESCGCSFLENLNVYNPEGYNLEFRDEINKFVTKLYHSSEVITEMEHILNSLVDNLNLNIRTKKHTSLFLLSLSEWLEVTLDWEHYSEIWYGGLQLIKTLFMKKDYNDSTNMFLEKLFANGFLLLSQMSDKKEVLNIQKIHDTESLFRDFSNEINTETDFNSLLDVLKKYIPEFGVTNMLIILPESEGYKLYPVTGYDDLLKKKLDINKKINLEEYRVEYKKNQMVMPLVCKNSFFGFMLMSSDFSYPQLYVNIQLEISKALLIINLFQSRDCLIEEKEELVNQHKLSEERYREMIDMVPMLMWESDENFKITYMNRLAEEKLGLKLGESLLSITDKEDRNKIELERFSDLKGLKIHKINNEGHILVIDLKDKINSKGEKIRRWHALDPLPMVLDNTLPTNDFFKDFKITARESEIVLLLFHGLKIREIANSISLAESTVKGHITKIYNKLGIDDREGLMDIISQYKVKKDGYGNYLFKIFNQLIMNQHL
ncbi:MAG: substrate-binding domain-containing protein [Spirochaetales bacterium]|nr:substrate-binding domain-containing protein [Spirochaetales bacterium]